MANEGNEGKSTQVGESYDSLRKNIEDVQEAVSVLEKALVSVLVKRPPKTIFDQETQKTILDQFSVIEDKKPPLGEVCKLAVIIRTQADAVKILSYRIRDITISLEI